MIRLRHVIADLLQCFYEDHRVVETWGSLSVSRFVFDRLRKDGWVEATGYLLLRLRETGHPSLPPFIKLTALLSGIMMVALANIFLKREKQPDMKQGARRQFSKQAPRIPVGLYFIGSALLVAASRYPGSSGGGGGGDESEGYVESGSGELPTYPGSDTSVDFRAYQRQDQEDGLRKRYDTDYWEEWAKEDDE